MRPSTNFVWSPLTIPYTHHTISLVPHRRPPIWPMDHVVIFPFLSLFSFTQCILSQRNQSQVMALHGQDLTICFTTLAPCAHFTYRLYLRLCIYSEKEGSFPQNSNLVLSFHLTPSRTFILFCTSDVLCTIAPSQTFVLHHFALLDTMSGDYFTAPKSHPSEPHRTYT